MKKIDTKQSLIYRFDDNHKDLADCVEKLGTNGYFSNVEDFEFYDTGVLTRVISDVNNYSYPFVRGDNAIEHKYFIPEDKVVFKEEIEYLNNENDTQFDVIDGLYTAIISAVLKNEISAGQFNTLCKAYEIQGGDTWEPETILRKVTVTDVKNIKPEYLKYFKKV